MTYVRNTSRGHLDALRIQRQISAAEVEKAEKELAQLAEIELDLARLQRRKENIAMQLRQARERTTTKRQHLALPPPIHGGPEGLAEATREIEAHKWKSNIMVRTKKGGSRGTHQNNQT